MRHRKKKKFGIGYDAGRRTVKSMTAALILQEKIQLTDARAKLIKSKVEKLISRGKNPTLHDKRQLFSALPANAARKVFEVLGPKYKDRPGGYLRIAKVGKQKDGQAKSQLEFI